MPLPRLHGIEALHEVALRELSDAEADAFIGRDGAAWRNQ